LIFSRKTSYLSVASLDNTKFEIGVERERESIDGTVYKEAVTEAVGRAERGEYLLGA